MHSESLWVIQLSTKKKLKCSLVDVVVVIGYRQKKKFTSMEFCSASDVFIKMLIDKFNRFKEFPWTDFFFGVCRIFFLDGYIYKIHFGACRMIFRFDRKTHTYRTMARNRKYYITVPNRQAKKGTNKKAIPSTWNKKNSKCNVMWSLSISLSSMFGCLCVYSFM